MLCKFDPVRTRDSTDTLNNVKPLESETGEKKSEIGETLSAKEMALMQTTYEIFKYFQTLVMERFSDDPHDNSCEKPLCFYSNRFPYGPFEELPFSQ